MKEINIYEIIKKHSNICFDDYDGVEEAIKDACQQVLELAAENAKIELREYEINGTYTSESLGQEIMIEEPNNYIGIDKQSILDVINQVK